MLWERNVVRGFNCRILKRSYSWGEVYWDNWVMRFYIKQRQAEDEAVCVMDWVASCRQRASSPVLVFKDCSFLFTSDHRILRFFKVYCLQRPPTSLDRMYPKNTPEEGGTGMDLLGAFWDKVWFIHCHELIQNGNQTIESVLLLTQMLPHLLQAQTVSCIVVVEQRRNLRMFSGSDAAVRQDAACWELTVVWPPR